MNTGTCLCGDITWEVDGEYSMLTNCHCSICRKAHGSAYGTYLAAHKDNFRWTSGAENIRFYESSTNGKRPFCPRCGASVAAVMEQIAFMPAGSMDGNIDRPLDCHIFVGSKASWFDISDEAPQFEGYPPEHSVTPVIRQERLPQTDGAISGSCGCGKVTFEFDGSPEKMGFCHCSRCRIARSAAFSAQAFIPTGNFRWLSGADNIDHYKVEDSTYFFSSFCRDCSSPAPRAFPEFDMVMIPAGSLDQDPGTRPQAHIYVGSKAPWHEITDDLPQFEEMPPTN